MKRVISAGLAAFMSVAPAVTATQAATIDHKPVGCIVAGQFPKFEACFAPSAEVARARVHFRAQGGAHWYYVEMNREALCHSALLPKPKKTTKRIDYYVDVVDKAFAEGRTPEYGPRVVSSAGECRRDLLIAGTVGAASIVLGAAGGAPSVPAGFEAEGIAGVGGPSGSGSGSGSGGGASGSGGGGGGAAFGFLLGAAAAGGGAYYLIQKDKEKDAEPSPSPSPSPPPSPAPNFDGEWSGTTSQDRSFAFTVARSTVTRLDTSYVLSSGNVLVLTMVQRTFSPGLPITNATFTSQEPGLLVTGTFASPTTASGRIEVGQTIIMWQATKR